MDNCIKFMLYYSINLLLLEVGRIIKSTPISRYLKKPKPTPTRYLEKPKSINCREKKIDVTIFFDFSSVSELA